MGLFFLLLSFSASFPEVLRSRFLLLEHVVAIAEGKGRVWTRNYDDRSTVTSCENGGDVVECNSNGCLSFMLTTPQ